MWGMVHTCRRGFPKIKLFFPWFMTLKAKKYYTLRILMIEKIFLSYRNQKNLSVLAFKAKNYEKQCLI